ncbi:hypothetical protein [Leptospira noguchii]|uniref:hypothetical protein n=1 Tax=Leptospira noguchii TaxID=28182 RepID=UPI0018AD54F4
MKLKRLASRVARGNSASHSQWVVRQVTKVKIIIRRMFKFIFPIKQKENDSLGMNRRSAIEPVISHLKHDHNMVRNFLKGKEGDLIRCWV